MHYFKKTILLLLGLSYNIVAYKIPLITNLNNNNLLTLDTSELLVSSNIMIGTPEQSLKVLLSTSHYNSWFKRDHNKTNSSQNGFNNNLSSSYLTSDIPFQDTYHINNTNNINGFWAKDYIRFDDKKLLGNFGLINNLKTPELSKLVNTFDGIIGLGPSIIGVEPNINISNDNSQYLSWLKLLNQQYNNCFPYFTFDINMDSNKGSIFTIGEYIDRYKQKKFNSHHIVAPSNKWELDVNNIQIIDAYQDKQISSQTITNNITNNINNNITNYITNNTALIDTSSLSIGLPSKLYHLVINQVIKNKSSCYYNNKLQMFSCNNINDCNKLPSIILTMANTDNKNITYNISKSEYTNNLDNGTCNLLLTNTFDDKLRWLLGLSFLNRYYAVFTNTNNILLYDKYQINENNENNVDNVDNFNKIVLILMSFAILIMGSFIILLIIYYYNYYKKNPVPKRNMSDLNNLYSEL